MLVAASTQTSIGYLLLGFALLVAIVYAFINIRQSKAEVGSEIELAANRKPYLSDEELEGPKLDRTLGLGLLGHGANLLLMLSAGRRGEAVFIDGGTDFADPLPQAFALTAIVITFGVIAFLLALAWRSVELTGDDLVEDDREDRRISSRREVVDEEIADEQVLAAEQADETRVARREEDR